MLPPFDPIGEVAQSVGQAAHGQDRFFAHLRNHRVIHISDGMAQFQLDQLHSFLDTAATASRSRGRTAARRICAHKRSILSCCEGGLDVSSLERAIEPVNVTGLECAADVTNLWYLWRAAILNPDRVPARPLVNSKSGG
jgi:hypothetical protein